jgi:hypothetical protein
MYRPPDTSVNTDASRHPVASHPARPAALPASLWWLVALYSVASLVHFWHNAEFIAFYPNMPAWLSRDEVYLAWLAVSAVGLVSGVMWLSGWRRIALCVLGLYGALGLDGLGHYTLALCSDHTLAMNLTIWSEAVTGGALAAVSFWHAR